MRYLFSIVLAALIAGCSVAPPFAEAPPEALQAWEDRQTLLNRIDAWSLNGRVAVTSEDEGWHGTLYWDQRADDYQIRIVAPLGQGTVLLEGRDGRATLRSSRDPAPVSATSAEALLLRQLGWRVPVEGLQHWVLGLPGPGAHHALNLDGDGHLARLEQGGWDVRFMRYSKVGDVDLPSKIFLENARLSVRVVIDRWKLEG